MTIIKTIGRNGEITLGKKYAGQDVILDEIRPGFWIIKCGSFMPDSERWLHETNAQVEIDEAVAWAEIHPPADSDLLDQEP